MFFSYKKSHLDLKQKRVILLIGGAGYVGKEFLKKIASREDLFFVVVSKNNVVSLNNVISFRFDIAKDQDSLIKAILRVVSRVDIIVHLAARYSFETSKLLSKDEMVKDFEVNTIAPLLVTQSCCRLFWEKITKLENEKNLRKVIVVGSQAGRGRTKREELITYSGTKAALKVMFEYYEDYLEGLGVKTIFLEPGGLQDPQALGHFIIELEQVI